MAQVGKEGQPANQPGSSLPQTTGTQQGVDIIKNRPITPMEGPGGGYPLDKPERSSKWNVVLMILIAIIAAVGINWIMVPRMAPSKTVYQSDITRLELDLVDIRADYVKTADLPDYTAVQNTANNANTKSDQNAAAITTLQGQFTAVTDSISNISGRLVNLETFASGINITVIQAQLSSLNATVTGFNTTIQSIIAALAANNITIS